MCLKKLLPRKGRIVLFYEVLLTESYTKNVYYYLTQNNYGKVYRSLIKSIPTPYESALTQTAFLLDRNCPRHF